MSAKERLIITVEIFFKDLIETFGIFPLIIIFICICYLAYTWSNAYDTLHALKKASLFAKPEEKLEGLKIFWKQRQYVAQLIIILLLMLIFFYLWSFNPNLS